MSINNNEPPKKEDPPSNQPEGKEEQDLLLNIRDEYKAKVKDEQWESIKNLTIPKQIKILKAFINLELPKIPTNSGTPEKPTTIILPAAINPAVTPATPDLPNIPTFMEKNKVGGEWWEKTIGSKQNLRMHLGDAK